MWNRAKLFVAGSMVVSAMLGGCGGSSTGPSPASLTGTWTATKMEFVKAGSPATTADLVAKGATVTLDLRASHDYTLTVKMPGQADELTTGTWSSSADMLSMTVTGFTGERQFAMNLSGNTITLGGADVDFDFNDDGIDEPAKLSMVLTK
ncbi:MAG: lipocalin family protein [Gemmatimonadaceae bacterium]|nr:lipocalin family protein [Gemmatimonadaceae bacterium]